MNLLGAQRFWKTFAHAVGGTFLLQLLVVDVIGCERDYIWLLALLEAAGFLYFHCSFESIHHGHAAVHEYHTILGTLIHPIFQLDALFHSFYGFFAIRHSLRLKLELYLNQSLQRSKVEDLIIDDQNLGLLGWFRLLLR